MTSSTLLLLLLSSSLVLSTRMIGYWSLENGYANQPGCAPVLTPDLIPAEYYTHIIYSFAFISTDGTVVAPTSSDMPMFTEVQAMKQRNPNLKTMISLGGWSMNMSLYSHAVSTPASRTTLVQSVMSYVRQWGWDGIDFDWEYPAAPERGGAAADTENFASFMLEMRQAVESESVPAGKSKLILSIPLPGGFFYGQNYNMVEMIQSLDFANIMAYNLHGSWETQVYCGSDFYDPTPASSPYHGYSINDAVMYFLNQNGNTLPASKFNLGMTLAGVGFTLANANSFAPGATNIGEGVGGPCTKEPGYMAYFEIESVLNNSAITPIYDTVEYCKYFVYTASNGSPQWIAYDDAQTLADKVALVKKAGLGGISIWAMYAESATGPVLQTSIHTALFGSSSNSVGSASTPSSSSPASSSNGTTSNSEGSTQVVNAESSASVLTSCVGFVMIMIILCFAV